MELRDLLAQRYSCRAYRPQAVPEVLLNRVLEAARLAPTACNLQPFRLIVVPTEGRSSELGRIYRKAWFSEAPLVIGIVALTGTAWRRRDGVSYALVDAAIAMDHLILAATEVGLGSCWIAAFDAGAAREVLGLPADVEPVAFTPLGYPADEPGPKERVPLATLVRYGRW